MAKIALITKRLTPTSLGLAKALHFQRHEVLLITSAFEAVPDGLPFQVLSFFKSWSTLEALRFFPRLLSQSPRVWHFVFTDLAEEKPTQAEWILARLAKAIPQRVVAASFYKGLISAQKWRLKAFVSSLDLITTGTRENLMYVKRQGWLGNFAECEVLPPLDNLNATFSHEEPDEDVHRLSQNLKNYLVLPCEKLNTRIDWQQITAHFPLIVLGARPAKASPSNIYYVGDGLSQGDLLHLLKHSSGLLTAFDEFSEVELMNFHDLCSESQTATIANLRQREALPGFCVPQRNGFVLDRELHSFRQLIHENPDLRLAQPNFEKKQWHLADSALNELSRLYSKIHHMKSTSVDSKTRAI